MIPFDSENIIYIQAENKRCYIVTTSGYFTVFRSLTALTNELPKTRFFRIHRSATVNMKFIKSFDGNSITMENGNVLPLSRYRSKLFLDAFSQFISLKRKSSV